jgi:hypothetical protein
LWKGRYSFGQDDRIFSSYPSKFMEVLLLEAEFIVA